ncbi:MAG: elongation factor G [Candidatus Bipolaricaulaceae bacterium]
MANACTVCFIGHSGSGKTTLAEALLKQAGCSGEANFDHTPEEERRGYSIDLSVGGCSYREERLTLLVTPGLGEFVEEIFKGVAAADLAVLVVNAEKPVEVVTEQAWEVRERLGRPALVFVNMLDKPGVDAEQVLAQLREGLPGNFWPLQLPQLGQSGVQGLVDLISGKPAAGVEEARSRLLEEVATFDDTLVEKVLADEPLGPEEVWGALRTGVQQGGIVPVLWGSAESGHGLPELLEAVSALAPRPQTAPGARAHVFSLAIDPYLGRLAYVKVLGSKLQEGQSLVNLRTKDKVQLRDVYSFAGTKLEKAGRADPGEAAALAKLDGVALGDTLAATADEEPEPAIPFPKPVFSRAVAPKSEADEEKLSMVMRELAAVKATLAFQRDPVTKEAILSGMGDVQLDVVAERLRTRYGVEVEYRVPKVPYRETIRKQGTGQYRHKKQTGGRGQFAEVHLRIEPLARGDGFEFADETKGGVIPGQFIPGVEKGVREAMQEGVVAGYPVVDLRAAVFYGQYHPVDSSELAFKIAAREAFKLAAHQADATLLEPVMTLAVTTPEAFTGDIISDLNSRRGRILGMESQGGKTVVRADVPLAEVVSYALDLKSLTQGRAMFQMEFTRYDFVPSQIQERVVTQTKARDHAG